MLSVYRLTAAVALVITASSANTASAQDSSRLPIIDVHLHAYPADFLGTVGLPNPLTNEPSAFQTDQQILSATLRTINAGLGVLGWLIPREAFHSYLKGLAESGLGKRLMFGSDQMIWPESIGMAIESIESADFLNAEEKRDIFYNNAVRFFRLDETRPDS